MNKSYNGKIESAQSDYAVKTRQEKKLWHLFKCVKNILILQSECSDNVTTVTMWLIDNVTTVTM